jgi:hypothetical protein
MERRGRGKRGRGRGALYDRESVEVEQGFSVNRTV